MAVTEHDLKEVSQTALAINEIPMKPGVEADLQQRRDSFDIVGAHRPDCDLHRAAGCLRSSSRFSIREPGSATTPSLLATSHAVLNKIFKSRRRLRWLTYQTSRAKRSS